MNKISLTYLISFFSLLSVTTFAATRQSGKILGSGDQAMQISLSAPRGGWTVDRMVEVAGKVSDTTVDPITININGDRYLLRTRNGNFSRKFPVTAGKNSILVQGTNKKGTVKVERTVYAQISPVAIMAILTSDTDGIYTDLHIYEPNSNLKNPYSDSSKETSHVYWADTNSKSGGKFYLNEQSDSYDQPGYGPYLYTHTSPPLGFYRIDANYWPSGDKAHALATLNLVIFGGQPQEIKKTIKAPLAKPGETVTLAWVRVEKGQKAYVFSPVVDAVPANRNLWPDWLIEHKPSTSGYGGGDY